MSFGERLFDLRQNAKVSLQTVADAIGISKAHVWELEKGHSTNPSFELVQKLAKYFGVTPEVLIGEVEVPTPKVQMANRIHRDLKTLSERDLELIEGMVRTLQRQSGTASGEEPR